MKKSVMVVVLLACAASSVFAAAIKGPPPTFGITFPKSLLELNDLPGMQPENIDIVRPTSLPRLVDAQFSAQELQSIMDAVHSAGKFKRPDLSKRTFKFTPQGLVLTNQLTFIELDPHYYIKGPKDPVTKVTVVSESYASSLLITRGAVYKKLTVGLSQGKSKWWKAVIEPVYDAAKYPPELNNAQLLNLSVGKFVSVPRCTTLASFYRNSVVLALKLAGKYAI